MASGTTIASAYVQVLPSTQGIKGGLESALSGGGGGLGKGLWKGILGTAGKVITGAAVLKVFKTAIDEGAKLQQSIGGVETLFGAGGKSLEEYAAQQGKSVDKVRDKYNALIAAQNAVMQNAGVAWKTAGLSQNDYMETVTSFAAALKASTKSEADAAKVADMAVIDMADNANKMGTPMEAIQNAYQGFAKQNYTMLDNLKLGYGGTQKEMKRLLKDAGKISGKKYNIKNLSDVYEAIHVIQGELGITGTTAEEAEKTFTGSFNAMKAAAANLFGKMGLGEDIGPALQDLLSSASNFLFGNLAPMILNVVKSAFSALPSLLPSIGDFILNGVRKLSEYNWGELGTTIMTGITGAFGETGDWLKKTILGENYTDESTWADVGTTVWNGIQAGVTTAFTGASTWLKDLFDSAVALVETIDFSAIGTKITDGVKTVIDVSGNWLKGLFDTAVEQVGTIDFSAIGTKITDGVKTVIDVSGNWLKTLYETASTAVQGVDWAAVGTKMSDGVKTVIDVSGNWLKGLYETASLAVQSIGWTEIGTKIREGVTGVIDATGNWLKTLFDAAKTLVTNIDWAGIGTAILNGVKGIIDAAGNWLKTLFTAGRDLAAGIGFDSLGTAIWNGVISKITEAGAWLSGLFTAARDAAAQLSFNDIGAAIWNGVQNGISSLMGAAGTWLSGLLGLGSWTDADGSANGVGGKIAGAIAQGVSGMFSLAGAAGKWLTSILGLGTWTDDGSSETIGSTIATNIKTGLGAIADGTGKFLSDGFSAAHDAISEINWKEVGSTILGGIQGALDGIRSIAGGIWEAIKNFFGGGEEENPVTDWTESTEEAMNQATPILNAAAQALGESATAALNEQFSEEDGRALFTNLANGIRMAILEADFTYDISQMALSIKTLVDTATDWETIGKKIGGKVAEGIKSKKAEVEKQAKALITAAKNKAGSEVGSGGANFKKYGTDISAGIAAGITGNKNKISDALVAAFDDAIQKLRRDLGLHSPSRLFADVIGKNVSLGIAKGITDYASSIDEALGAAMLPAGGYGLAYNPEFAGAESRGFTQNITVNSPKALTPAEIARQTRNATRQLVLDLGR